MTAYMLHQKALNLCKFNLRNWCTATLELRKLDEIEDEYEKDKAIEEKQEHHLHQ